VAKLKDYETSKKDMKRGVEQTPDENYRMHSEDKYTDKHKPHHQIGSKSGASTSASTPQGSMGGAIATKMSDIDPEQQSFREPS